jgi:ribosomal protein S18 acetylase RimI-like enzyme
MLAELGARTFSDTFLADNRPEDIAAFLAATYSPSKQAAELADAANVFLLAVPAVPAALAAPAPNHAPPSPPPLAVGFAKLRRGAAPSCVEGAAPLQIDRLYVTRAHLGRGIGEALMRRCVEEASAASHDTIWLGVWERNTRALAFYRRWGFRIVGAHSFQLGADLQNDLLMCRAVTARRDRAP